MKTMLFGSVAVVALQLAEPVSSWMTTIGARPEALMTGSALILLASMLRRSITTVARVK
jgi:hypothetical protein